MEILMRRPHRVSFRVCSHPDATIRARANREFIYDVCHCLPMSTTSHGHLFIPGTEPIRPPLVMLHGSGGAEHELVPLAADVGPGSPTLGIRGTVPIDGGFAFFHRFADRAIEGRHYRRVSYYRFHRAATTRYNFTNANRHRVPVARSWRRRCS
jgi:hypothetical protein